MDPRHQLKRNQRDSQTWERGEDGTWQPSQPADRSSPPPATLTKRQSHEQLRKRNRLRDPRVVEKLQAAARKVMMVKAFRDSLTQELGGGGMAAVDAMLGDMVMVRSRAPHAPLAIVHTRSVACRRTRLVVCPCLASVPLATPPHHHQL